MPEKSRLMPISYYNPKQEIRLSAYADTIVLEPDGCEQHLRAIRFGGYPEMVRAMSDAIYAGATLETEFAGETAMLTCEPKKYECHLSHDGIYAEATILSLDDEDAAAKKGKEAQADGQTNVELPPRKCVLFCPAGDRQALFEALDRKTSVPLIPEFQDYVLDELRRRRWLKPLRVISIRERLEAWLLLCKKDDANIVKVLEDGLKTGAIRIPGTVQNPNGFDRVHSVTSYLSAFGVTVAERIRNQFQPLFDPAAEQLSPEILRINDEGLVSEQGVPAAEKSANCIFEQVYFARPDSIMNGKSVYACRYDMGRQLAHEEPVEADLVIGVPDSGLNAAKGYAMESGIPYNDGLIKNRYIGRTFIQPSQEMRDKGVKMKLSPVRSIVKDKRIILVDDSIVRGTTSLRIVRMLREAGAKEVHMRIASPMIKNPCFYGVDMSTHKELLCYSRNLEQARQAIEADSLAFLSEQGLFEAGHRSDLCLACFNGNYPTALYSSIEEVNEEHKF